MVIRRHAGLSENTSHIFLFCGNLRMSFESQNVERQSSLQLHLQTVRLVRESERTGMTLGVTCRTRRLNP